MADKDGYAPNPSDKRFQDMIEAEFSAAKRPPAVPGNAAAGNPDLDEAAKARREEQARHDYMGRDASDVGRERGVAGAAEQGVSGQGGQGEQSGAGQPSDTNQSGQAQAATGETTAEEDSGQPKRWDTSVTGKAKPKGFKGFVKKRLPTLVIVATFIGSGGAILGGNRCRGLRLLIG